ncbi:hypothetical protein ACFQV8_09910 [Pseudonocardia benzenivorans]
MVDDAHLLDRPSAEALLFTARRLLADPVVLLLAARTGEPHALAGADLPELVLTGVDLAAAQEIVRRAGGRPVAVDLVARLHRVVAGNPLALLELADDPHRAEDGPRARRSGCRRCWPPRSPPGPSGSGRPRGPHCWSRRPRAVTSPWSPPPAPRSASTSARSPRPRRVGWSPSTAAGSSSAIR